MPDAPRLTAPQTSGSLAPSASDEPELHTSSRPFWYRLHPALGAAAASRWVGDYCLSTRGSYCANSATAGGWVDSDGRWSLA